jgi:polysaccharide export outer membrane protein
VPPVIAAYPRFSHVANIEPTGAEIRLCQGYALPPCGACVDYGPRPLCAVECPGGCYCDGQEPTWHDKQMLPFDLYGHGEYVGPARMAHVAEYRIRVDDVLEFVYRLTREETRGPYKLEVGDEIKVESLTDANLDRPLVIQPDGTITVRLLGQVRAAHRTVSELTADLDERYKKYYKVPAITVTPVKVNTRLEDLRDSVDARFGQGGQARQAKVTPEGTIQLPAIGSVPAQGLTLEELKREVDERYNALVQGIEVTPVLVQRAPRFVYVLGEVLAPGRYELTGPTSAMQAVTLAGGWNNGGNLRRMVIFRRGDDWRLMATQLDLRGAMLGHAPCPADEIWIRDSDIVLVPKSTVKVTNDFIELVFTRGIYGVVPMNGVGINFAKLSSI